MFVCHDEIGEIATLHELTAQYRKFGRHTQQADLGEHFVSQYAHQKLVKPAPTRGNELGGKTTDIAGGGG